jgi:hypothetical protein
MYSDGSRNIKFSASEIPLKRLVINDEDMWQPVFMLSFEQDNTSSLEYAFRSLPWFKQKMRTGKSRCENGLPAFLGGSVMFHRPFRVWINISFDEQFPWPLYAVNVYIVNSFLSVD